MDEVNLPASVLSRARIAERFKFAYDKYLELGEDVNRANADVVLAIDYKHLGERLEMLREYLTS